MTSSGAMPALDDLATLDDVAARGRALERVVAELFRKYHFTVIVGSHAARPRQTDVFAVKLSERYLIECKWQVRKATIGDLDNLRSRLSRTHQEVVGLLVSMSGFADEVLAEVANRRQQPVLLVSGQELRDVESGFRHSLPDLLSRKKEVLLRDAHVLLDEPRRKRRDRRHVPYPLPTRRFSTDDVPASLVYRSGGGFGRFTFVHELPDIDWNSSSGVGVSLDVPLEIGDEAEFSDAIDTLVDLGWTTEHSRWSIKQRSHNWHGFGAESLIAELPSWKERAEHHSEEAVYVDRCDNGFYTLTTNLAAHPSRRASMTELCFQLEGQPLDTSPLLHLCHALGAYDNLRVRPRSAASRTVVHLREAPIGLTVRGNIVTDDLFDPSNRDHLVCGVVVDNPYWDQTKVDVAQRPPDGLRILTDSEVLICDLRQFHAPEEAHGPYFLDRIEWAWTSDTLVCRPVADWSDL